MPDPRSTNCALKICGRRLGFPAALLSMHNVAFCNRARSTPSAIFKVRQGIRTGDNRAFLLSIDEWESLPSQEREYFRPAATNSTIRNGRLFRTKMVFYPYGSREIASADELEVELTQYCARWLKPRKEFLIAREGIEQNRWWI